MLRDTELTESQDKRAPEDPQAAVRPAYKLRLTQALRAILMERGEQGLTLGYIVEVTGERAFGVLMAFLCLPFLQPIPIPGASTPFGLTLMVLGIEVAVGWHRPWIPRRMARWRLPAKLATKLIALVAKIFTPLEKIVRPRLLFMQNRPAFVGVGLALAANGLVLSLPLPIPFSNTIPAWISLILILGLTEEDGVCLLTGAVLTAAEVALAVATLVMGWGAVMRMVGW